MLAEKREKFSPYLFSLLLFGMFVAFAFIVDSPANIGSGLVQILFSPSLLGTDYIAVGGLGAAFVSAALAGCLDLLVLAAAKTRPSGATIMAVWLAVGFSFYGRNVLNSLPVLLGVWLYARYQKEPFANYSLTALLASTLAPVASGIACIEGLPLLPGCLLGLLFGVGAGFLMPPITAAATRVHSGYNLYNAGFAGGVIAIFVAGILTVSGAQTASPPPCSEGNNLPLAVILYLVMAAFLCYGISSIKQLRFKHGYRELLSVSGRLVTDYYLLHGGYAFINMGIVGMIGTSVTLLLGAEISGSILAGIFAIVAFGCFGKNPKNILSVMLGAILMSMLGPAPFNAAGNVSAIMFSTGLAPIAGQYGPLWGVLAGMLHMIVVMQVGSVNGGFNLYNNGFAAGFVALVLVPLILAFKRGRNSNEAEI